MVISLEETIDTGLSNFFCLVGIIGKAGSVLDRLGLALFHEARSVSIWRVGDTHLDSES